MSMNGSPTKSRPNRRWTGRLAGLAAAVVATGGLAAVTAAPAQAACSTSVFEVVWNYAGVYYGPVRDDAYLIPGKTKRHGEHVTGPSRSTSGGWTTVYLGEGGVGFMVDAAIKYIGCR